MKHIHGLRGGGGEAAAPLRGYIVLADICDWKDIPARFACYPGWVYLLATRKLYPLSGFTISQFPIHRHMQMHMHMHMHMHMMHSKMYSKWHERSPDFLRKAFMIGHVLEWVWVWDFLSWLTVNIMCPDMEAFLRKSLPLYGRITVKLPSN